MPFCRFNHALAHFFLFFFFCILAVMSEAASSAKGEVSIEYNKHKSLPSSICYCRVFQGYSSVAVICLYVVYCNRAV